ncbi:protein-L-isoaspartate O-methyltransferase [Limtongia smithiae]|uniref:protein-L-isoaspartate O-methyltransferase n=1 Tax=Limtongia smithiae TaxID=1125753 RepID=UPI0034CD063F
MAWRCSAASNSGLIDNLASAHLLTTPRLISAFKAIDRGCFSPRRPYDDAPQALGFGATISAPHMHAAAAESLAAFLVPGAKVLDIGSGSGYLVAVFAKLVVQGDDEERGKVFGVEHIRELNEAARERFTAALGEDGERMLADGDVVFRTGDGRYGWPGEQFDAIHIGAAIPTVTDALLAQLKSPGKMFVPVGSPDESQYIYEITKDSAGNVTREQKFGVSYVPLADSHYYYARGSTIVPLTRTSDVGL